MGLFFDTPVRRKKTEVKKYIPEKVWLRPDYLPYLKEACSLEDVEFLTDRELLEIDRPLGLDVELYPNYFELGISDMQTNKVAWEESSIEKDDIECSNVNWSKIEWILTNKTTVGFNSWKYDIPVLLVGLFTRNIKDMHYASVRLIEDDVRVNDLYSELKMGDFIKEIIPKIDHIDLKEVAPLKGGLKIYAARVHISDMMDLPFPPHTKLSEHQKKIVRYYNLARDMRSTAKLWHTLLPQIELRCSMSKQYEIDLRSRSDAQIAEHVIKHELKRIMGRVPKQPEIAPGAILKYNPPAYLKFTYGPFVNAFNTITQADYEVSDSGGFIEPPEITALDLELNGLGFTVGLGGLHSKESCAKWVDDGKYQLWDFDVASYYPNIILNLGLFPRHLTEAFLHVYRNIVENRLDAKAKGLKVIANSLKIVINGSFGKLGSKYSNLYSPDLMIAVTLTGQLCLLMLIDMLHAKEISVVSANTDGIVIRPRYDQVDIMRATVKEWEAITGFEMEGNRYLGLFSRDVNNYWAIKCAKKNGEFVRNVGSAKAKGAFGNPWASEDDISDRLKKNPTTTVVVEAVEKFLTTGVPIRDTIENETDVRKFVAVRSVKDGAAFVTNYDPPKHSSKMELVSMAGFVRDSSLYWHHSDFDKAFTLSEAYDIAKDKLSSNDIEYLGKSIRWYYSKSGLGNLISVKSGNSVPDSEGAKPMMQLAKTIPNDIDIDWYVNRAERYLKEVGFYS